MKSLSHDGRAALLRQPNISRSGGRRPVKPIEKVSEIISQRDERGYYRDVLMSLPRIPSLERSLDLA